MYKIDRRKGGGSKNRSPGRTPILYMDLIIMNIDIWAHFLQTLSTEFEEKF